MGNEKINMSDAIWGDTIRIIIYGEDGTGKVITKYINGEYDFNTTTYKDAVNIAKENGFDYGTFLMIVENPLRGIIYQYANCYDEPYWHEYGTTIGYA